MKTILLTGGTWYIGSHTAVTFLEKGYEVVIVDNLYNSDKSVLESLKKITGKTAIFYEGDIRDKSFLQDVFSKHSFDCVIHFAGLKAVGESCDRPFMYYENNLVWSLHLFEVMDDFWVRNIIFSSTGTVYNQEEKRPFSEDTPTGNTTNPYSSTKHMIETILRDLAAHKSFNVISLRYFNPIWAHKSWLLGEDPNDEPNNLLPYVIQVAVEHREYLKVFGDNYQTKDGTGERDYVHVLDLADAHYKAYSYIVKQPDTRFEAINIGTGKSHSVLDIIKLTQKVIGQDIAYKVTARRDGDLDITYCCPIKAENLLGFKARYTVEEAIADQYNFVKAKLKK